MNKLKVVLIGGEWDLTRMVIDDRGGCPLEMVERSSMYVTSRTWLGDIPTEAHCQILMYHRTVKLSDGTWVYEYRPHE